MKRALKIFIIYFPVMLVAGQVLVNLLSFIAPGWYRASGFYLNTFFGVNLGFALFLVAFTYVFGFCSVSRWCAYAELAFAANFMIVQEDNLYNILFQVIGGILAIMLTFRQYIKRFPLCNLSLLTRFYKFFITSKCSCERALERWTADTKSRLLKHHHESKH